MGLLKNPVLSQTVGATLRGCPVFMPIFRVGTETYPLHSALFQQPQDACTTNLFITINQRCQISGAESVVDIHNRHAG